MSFEKGNSRGGRTKGALNKIQDNERFKKVLRGISKEALENIIKMMRNASTTADELEIELAQLRLQIQELRETLPEGKDSKELVKLERQEASLLKEIKGAREDSGKYAIKITDYVYNLVLHDDKIELQKKKVEKDVGQTLVEEEEEDDLPHVSVVPLKAVSGGKSSDVLPSPFSS